jgi:hypothetical protein
MAGVNVQRSDAEGMEVKDESEGMAGVWKTTRLASLRGSGLLQGRLGGGSAGGRDFACSLADDVSQQETRGGAKRAGVALQRMD